MINFALADDMVDSMVVCGVVPALVKVLRMVSNGGDFDADTCDVEKECVYILGLIAPKVISLYSEIILIMVYDVEINLNNFLVFF